MPGGAVILEGRFSIPADQERVWDAIWDVPTLASWVPGCTAAEQLTPETYRVHLEQQVAFMKAAFDLHLRIVEASAPERVRFHAEGADRRLGSNVNVESSVTLAPLGPNETQLAYRHDMSIFGKLGALGFPIIQRKAREIEAEFARRARATFEGGAGGPAPAGGGADR
jgi:carbon monoxide dehydrogenase subunit G